MSGLSNLEQEVVDLLDEGWSRWKIAEMLGLGETTVREVIKRLCVEYECSQRDLPKKTRAVNLGEKEEA